MTPAAASMVVREKGCTCRTEIVMANAKSGPDHRYLGHESSCALHWQVRP